MFCQRIFVKSKWNRRKQICRVFLSLSFFKIYVLQSFILPSAKKKENPLEENFVFVSQRQNEQIREVVRIERKKNFINFCCSFGAEFLSFKSTSHISSPWFPLHHWQKFLRLQYFNLLSFMYERWHFPLCWLQGVEN